MKNANYGDETWGGKSRAVILTHGSEKLKWELKSQLVDLSGKQSLDRWQQKKGMSFELGVNEEWGTRVRPTPATKETKQQKRKWLGEPLCGERK
jgi:hypothetical protein